MKGEPSFELFVKNIKSRMMDLEAYASIGRSKDVKKILVYIRDQIDKKLKEYE